MWGDSDSDLYLRWVQFSAFSPVFRFHSTSNPFELRLPWDYGKNIPQQNLTYTSDKTTEEGTKAALALRMKLLPYIYSHLHLMHNEALPFIAPLYFYNPEDKMATLAFVFSFLHFSLLALSNFTLDLA